MGVAQHLTEPWGIVAAGLLGGLGGAVTAALAPAAVLGVPVGLAIFGAVYGVRVGLGALLDREPEHRAGAGDLPAPPPGSPAAGWLARAGVAVATLHRQAARPADPTVRGRVGDVDDEAAGVLDDLRRLAGQVTLIEQAAARIDAGRLAAERDQLRLGLTGLPAGPLREERERALAAVTDQLEVLRRLGEARETMLARMQSAVLGLEGLVARLGELLALHAATGGASLTAARLGELTHDLEGMRAGLTEAERLSRSTLGAGAAPEVPGTGHP